MDNATMQSSSQVPAGVFHCFPCLKFSWSASAHSWLAALEMAVMSLIVVTLSQQISSRGEAS